MMHFVTTARLAQVVWMLVATTIVATGQTTGQTTEQANRKNYLPPLESLDTAKGGATVSSVTSAAKPSIVTIHAEDRDGKERGLGTGFVIPGGQIITNLHVTGEGRRFRVEDSQGQDIPISHVEAWNRRDDLIVLRPRQKPTLPALTLADDESLEVGESIVVVGNPLGLKHSVVSGVLSGAREVEGRRMLQLAIPVEPGNSGGPVLDMRGRVHGIVTMKSLLTNNLGFAIRVASLRRLLQRQNPIPIDKWQRLGAVDEFTWEPLQAQWRQRAATIRVTGMGPGFGGRAQCLARQAPPELPYEVAVQVKLDDEAGAAGLVFHADGKDRHYGFYPSNGNLRLTCFLGPSVYSWRVLHNAPSPHYRSGEWNHLRVRVEKEQVLCYVNHHLAVRLGRLQLHSGRVGLAKFRNTVAEFRHFRVGAKLGAAAVDEATQRAITEAVEQLGPLGELLPGDLKPLQASPAWAAKQIADRAEALERQAADLRKLQDEVRVRAVCEQLRKLKSQASADQPLDLAHAALLIAKLDDADLDVAAYRRWLTALGERLQKSLPKDSDPGAKRKRLDEFFFVDNAFQGSHHEYDHRANSHLHRVLEDREGLPITLSVVYMTLGRQIGLNVEGVGLPGHFVVRPASELQQDAKFPLVDVFHGGKELDREATTQLVAERTELRLREEHLRPVDELAILNRMLRNLLGVAQQNDDKPGMLRYLEALVTLDEESVSERGMRAVLRFETGRKAAALADLDWILQRAPAGLDLRRIQQMRDQFQRMDPPSN